MVIFLLLLLVAFVLGLIGAVMDGPVLSPRHRPIVLVVADLGFMAVRRSRSSNRRRLR
ncbi:MULTISPECIES: hypothetical protein [Streptomyces]|uniref:hypothetical protein n=1 Tax=Streptomyces TaxID=1883 RepID=UPI0031E8447E